MAATAPAGSATTSRPPRPLRPLDEVTGVPIPPSSATPSEVREANLEHLRVAIEKASDLADRTVELPGSTRRALSTMADLGPEGIRSFREAALARLRDRVQPTRASSAQRYAGSAAKRSEFIIGV